MELIISQKFEVGNIVIYPIETSGKTYFSLVKIEDVLKIEKKNDDTYRIFYNVLVYDTINAGTEVPQYRETTVEESKLITIEEFTVITSAF